MAARQGADKVYACELSKTMVAMSHDILAANGLLNDVNLINAVSTELSVPRDLPERYVGAAACDVGIQQMLYHCKESLGRIVYQRIFAYFLCLHCIYMCEMYM